MSSLTCLDSTNVQKISILDNSELINDVCIVQEPGTSPDKEFVASHELKRGFGGNTKYYQCPECEKKFTNEEYLRNHAKVHLKGSKQKHIPNVDPLSFDITIKTEIDID